MGTAATWDTSITLIPSRARATGFTSLDQNSYAFLCVILASEFIIIGKKNYNKGRETFFSGSKAQTFRKLLKVIKVPIFLEDHPCFWGKACLLQLLGYMI
jgi:hypothetical protein